MGNRVLFVTFEYDQVIAGGVGRVLNGVVPLIREKADLHILLLLVNKHNIYKMRNNQWVKKRYSRYRIHRLYRLISSERSYAKYRWNLFSSLFKMEEYDVVHFFHISWQIRDMVKLLRERYPKTKIIYSCHSISKYEFQIRNCHPEFLEYEDYLVKHVDHIHFLNQSSLKYFHESYPECAGKVTYSIIPNGIAEDCLQTKDTRFEKEMIRLLHKNGRLLVLCMSRWCQGKGLEYLLEAIPKVIERYPNIQFVIAGRKPTSWEFKYQEFLKAIDQQIAALGNQVISLGWLNDEQRNTLFTMADIWVMPSLLEYFPFSILEPMMAQIAIVASRIDSVVEMLQENEECLFYEPKNPDELALQISILAENPDLRRKIARNAYQRAQKYGWDSIAEQYLQMYQVVLSDE